MPHNNPFNKLIQRGFIAHKNPQMISISSSKDSTKELHKSWEHLRPLEEFLDLEKHLRGAMRGTIPVLSIKGEGENRNKFNRNRPLTMSVLGFLDGPMKPQTTPNNITIISTHTKHTFVIELILTKQGLQTHTHTHAETCFHRKQQHLHSPFQSAAHQNCQAKQGSAIGSAKSFFLWNGVRTSAMQCTL